MEINIRVQPHEAAELVSLTLLDGKIAQKIAHAASGAAVALGGRVKFTARFTDEDPDAEFDRFIAWMARNGAIPVEDLAELIKAHSDNEPSEEATEP